ncbi:DUF2249 domain-containing protein [Zoogloea sp.]|uniref:sulfurtransferase TusA family protein n=1 Tax=Zoogloea sp. TaxID=49181 RepID=UPI002633F470|nr:DUF2249 domain-containing protein [Zoogloea sp.]MDD3352415.1 DUF2249 domain-containing protein [Zoogloea sp.]
MPAPPDSVVVDARGLMPPEPMHRTLEALDVMPPEGEVILLLYREPTPLYDMLHRNGYTYRVKLNEQGEYAIHIRHATTGTA